MLPRIISRLDGYRL